MRLEYLKINTFRSIEGITIRFPKNKPVVIFGPNNVGKSNILRAMDCLLGEKYSPYFDFQDSDYFLRDKQEFPNISLRATFDEEFYKNEKYNQSSKSISFTTNLDVKGRTENAYHFDDEGRTKMFLSNEQRSQCSFILVDATRDISRQLSYYSQYSLLSKMAKKMHGAIVETTKKELDDHFTNIKKTFESVPEYKQFHERLQESFQNNISGFEHKLEIDLSAYDPNNYFNSLRIIAKDGTGVRSFDEFGTGEQQILLMSFVKAYAETFKGQNFILGIEEPEAHLHPLAQRWLAKNINNIASSGVQVVITTHSPEFLDIENLEGFVKAYKVEGVTKITQNSPKRLAEKCIEFGADAKKVTEGNILDFYKTNTFYDQLKGFFARKIILVEGPTEVFSLPNYFSNHGYDLIKNGVDIIDCRGKSQIARNYRLFSAYEYYCFCRFDGDNVDEEKQRGNKELADIFKFDADKTISKEDIFTCDAEHRYGYFGKDFESYMRKNIEGYSKQEVGISGSKPLKAKIISQLCDIKPDFINQIAQSLNIESDNEENNKIVADPNTVIDPDDIPF